MRKIYFFCSLIVFLLVIHSNAQAWKWGRGSTGGVMDSWVVATDPSGNVFTGGLNTSNSYTGTPKPAVFGTYTVAFSTATISGAQTVIAKYDSSGNFIWAIGTQNGDTWLINIKTDSRGNCIVLGSFSSSSVQIGSVTLTNSLSILGQAKYFLVKLDPSGNVIWAKSDGGAQPGGTFISYPLISIDICSLGGVAIDDTGNIYIASNYSLSSVTVGTYTLTNTDPSGTTDDILLAKYDSSGNITWAKSYGGHGDDNAYGLTITPAGDIYIAGVIRASTIIFGVSTISDASGGAGNGFIARFDNSGSAHWATGTGGREGDYAAGLAADSANNVYLTGGLVDSFISLSGTIISNPYPGQQVAYLAKFDPANNVSWYNMISGSLDYMAPSSAIVMAAGYAVTVSGCDNVWVSGGFTGNADLHDGTVFLPTIFSTYTEMIDVSVFLVGFNTLGTFIDGRSLEYGGDDQDGIAADAFGNIYLCADYATTATVMDAPPLIIGNDTFASVDMVNGGEELQYVAKFKPKAAPDIIAQHQDTAICSGNSVTMAAAPGYSAYLWSNGNTADTLATAIPGLYIVNGYNSCGTIQFIDSFTITILPADTVYAHYDTTICAGSGMQLTAPTGYLNYLWDNGATTATMDITAPGAYWVSVLNNCPSAIIIDTFHVTDGSTGLLFSWPADTVACGPVTLTVPLSGPSFLWQDGSSANTYTADKSALYYVTVSENGCSLSDSIMVNVIDVSQHLQDTTFCDLSFAGCTLFANVPTGASVLWSTGSMAPSIKVADTGSYWVAVTDGMCASSDTMQLKIEQCNCVAYLPTAFTPNNDGKNDTYHPIFENGCYITGYYFAIYNRWGARVFFALSPDEKWDGTCNGAKAETGTYMYYLKYATGLNEVPYTLKGDITLLR